jgi:hypothetical protein
VALAVLVAIVALPVLAFGGGGDDERSRPDGRGAAADAERSRERLAQLPRGGRSIFPRHRVVAFYGAPQDDELGALGIGTPDQAARRLERVARGYRRRSRPVLPAMELIATIVTAAPGADGQYRTRQRDAVIRRYLRAARRRRMLLLLDIQPGRADFVTEAWALRRWLREPDVGLALDPEWRMGPGEVPGNVIGSVSAREVNEVSAWLAGIVRERRLPEKLFVIHQFTDDMIEGRAQVIDRPGLATTFNVDGFGDRPNKRSKYDAFTDQPPRYHDGFKLFFREDVNLMRPRQVLALTPPPDLVVYE